MLVANVISIDKVVSISWNNQSPVTDFLKKKSPVIKIMDEIEFEKVWGRSKQLFRETIINKIFETNSSFQVTEQNTGNFNLYFLASFCKYQQNFPFARRAWH